MERTEVSLSSERDADALLRLARMLDEELGVVAVVAEVLEVKEFAKEDAKLEKLELNEFEEFWWVTESASIIGSPCVYARIEEELGEIGAAGTAGVDSEFAFVAVLGNMDEGCFCTVIETAEHKRSQRMPQMRALQRSHGGL